MEDDQLKEQEELRNLLDTPTDEGDSPDEKDKNTPEDEDKDKNQPEETEELDKSEEDKGDGEEKDKDKKEDRWKGKSREDVIKEVESLESRLSALENKGKDKDKETKTDKDKKDNGLKLPSAEELQKMTPSDFAKWVLARIDEGVKSTIASQEKIRDSVRQEIADAKKDHPLDDPDYRKMVLAIIDAASAKGTTIALKDACKQVDAFLGKHKGESEEISEDERTRLKKAKAQVESGAGAPTQPESSDAETQRIQKALGGSGSKSPLGGLGI